MESTLNSLLIFFPNYFFTKMMWILKHPSIHVSYAIQWCVCVVVVVVVVCVCVCVGGGNSMPRGYVARVIGVNNRHHSFAVTYCYPRF